MTALNGRYYLICASDNYDTTANYRIDRITGIKVLDERAKSEGGLAKGLKLNDYMAERPYMFAGESERIKFKIEDCVVDQAVDWFGDKIKFEQRAGEILAEVFANREAFFHWALQYCLWVEVTEQGNLRAKLA